MKSILVKPFSKLANLILLSGAVFVLAACSDSNYNAPGSQPDDGVVEIVIGLDEPEALSVVISGVVVDKVTGSVINDARVDFFEGLEKATNIILPDGTDTEGEDLANGSFQVSVKDIEQFRVEASANGYLDSSAIVNIEEGAQVVYVIVELLAEEVEGVAAAEEEFAASEDGTVDANIAFSSDSDDATKTTDGQALVEIDAGNELRDEAGEKITVTSIKLEVSYIETQEATEEDEEVLSIADVIPEGLNSDSDGENVLVPVGVTEVNMTAQDGTPIKNFRDPITITLKLPAASIEPYLLFDEAGELEEQQNLRVRSYDTETETWTTELDGAVTVSPKEGNLYPVAVTVDHLTIFAITAEVTACENNAAISFTGSAVPETGLELVVEAGDLRQTYAVSSNNLVISKDDLLKDEDGYKVYVTDSSGESWLAVEEESEPVEPEEPQVPETVITVPTQESNTQHVYISESTLSEDGSQVSVTVSYMADDSETTGVGFSLNYDSSALTLNGVSNILEGAIASGSQSPDSSDSDEDSSTDQQLNFGWVSIFGQFPGSDYADGADLATITFDIAADAVGTTTLNFKDTSIAAGYSFAGQSQVVGIAAEAVEPVEPVSDGYKLCSDEATTIDLVAPAQPVTYSKNLNLNLQCTNDSSVYTVLTTALVSYFSDSNPIPVVAEASAGSYQLTGLTEGSTYTVTVDTLDYGVVVYDADNNGIETSNTDETRNIGKTCSTATGTGSS